jgi:toxin ParE1/3/4
VTSTYVVRPRADQDLEEQAFYYATEVSLELGHRFLVAAHETFALLAAFPHMGWKPKFKDRDLSLARVFRVEGFERILVIYIPRDNQVDILRVVHGSRNLAAYFRRKTS